MALKQQLSEFIPSIKTIEGEIDVKSKTLGRWQTKKFQLDPDGCVFVIHRENSKKKPKIFDLKFYRLVNQKSKKDRYQFDLDPISAATELITLSSTNEKFFHHIFGTLQVCCEKQSLHRKSLQVMDQNYRMESNKTELNTKPNQTDIQLNAPRRVQSPHQNPKSSNSLPDYFEINEVMNNLKIDHNQQSYNLVFEKESLKIWNNLTNPLLYKAEIIIQTQPQITQSVLLNLISNLEELKLWNQYVSQESQVVREVPEEKSNLIIEQRIFKGYFPFPRDYIFLRHQMEKQGEVFILDRSVDFIDVQSKCVKGFIKYAIWRVSKSEGPGMKLNIITETQTGGLINLQEDSFFTLKYLEQLSNLLAYAKENALQLNENTSEIQEYQKPQVNSDDIFNTAICCDKTVDEFFDCEQYEEQMREILYLPQGTSVSKALGDVEDYEVVLPQTSDDQVEWVKQKQKLLYSGELNYFHLKHKYVFHPLNKPASQRASIKGNFLYADDWQREDTKGGLRMINQAKINAQKQVVLFLLKRIGVNLLTGKSITTISMPVDIFETRSNTERISNSFCFAPYFLERATKTTNPVARVKDVLGFTIGFLVSYLSPEKPFNPILGETFQGWIDKCPIYVEQIKHHPPVMAIQFYGRKYKVEACLEISANLHSNSVSGKNTGKFVVNFEDGQCVRIILAPGQITGTTYGDRICYFFGKTLCMDLENQIFAELTHNPEKKVSQYLGIPHQNLQDFLCGGIFKVGESAIQRFNKEGFQKFQGLDKYDIKEILHKVDGRITIAINVDSIPLFDVNINVPSELELEKFPLASDSNYRKDLLLWKLRDKQNSQSAKEEMENFQRNDRKLREQYQKQKS